ncbi:hypothetical protein HY414_02320 [Candidatus Kaiserbacteria bacterium]|nr:hypothetical protein [Candidatus Kaiserbacteria bacterium]
MVRQTLRFLASPVRGLQAAVYVLAASALLSSLLALVRDRLFAASFGAGTELDLYYAAFRIPDFLFVMTGALVSVYILIPELTRRSKEIQKEYIDTIVLGFCALAVTLSVIAAIFAPALLGKLFPQFAASGYLPILVGMTRIMLLQPILLGLSNILASITQLRGRYMLYAASPLLYNVGIIVGLVAFYPYLGVAGLAWGVVLGAMLHLGIQLPSILSDGFFRSVPIFRDGAALLHTAAISIPRALTLSMNQITFTGLTALASGLSAGSIAVYIFGFNLMSVPLSVIGASYSVAAFPTLASALAEGRMREFIEYVATAARYILFWSLPAVGLIIVLRAHIVRVILGSGSFDWTDTRLTAAVFALLTVSLTAQSLSLLLARAYYAAGRTFIPFFIAASSTLLTLSLGIMFTSQFVDAAVLQFAERLLRLEDVPGSAIVALPIAFSLVSIVAATALLIHFEGRFGGFFAQIRETLLHALLAGFGAAAAAYAMLTVLGPLELTSTLVSVFVRGALGGIVGIGGAALVYAIVRNREYAETIIAARARLWRVPLPKAQPIASAEEVSASSPQ